MLYSDPTAIITHAMLLLQILIQMVIDWLREIAIELLGDRIEENFLRWFQQRRKRRKRLRRGRD